MKETPLFFLHTTKDQNKPFAGFWIEPGYTQALAPRTPEASAGRQAGKPVVLSPPRALRGR